MLAGTTEGKTTFTLSGAQASSVPEFAARLSAKLGQTITAVPVPGSELVQGMVAAGLPQPVAQLLASFDANTAAGYVGTVTDDYRRITGRAPQSLDDWLTAHRDQLSGTP